MVGVLKLWSAWLAACVVVANDVDNVVVQEPPAIPTVPPNGINSVEVRGDVLRRTVMCSSLQVTVHWNGDNGSGLRLKLLYTDFTAGCITTHTHTHTHKKRDRHTHTT